jgi:HicB family
MLIATSLKLRVYALVDPVDMRKFSTVFQPWCASNWVVIPPRGRFIFLPEVHSRALVAAQLAGKSLNQWATEVLQHAVQSGPNQGQASRSGAEEL